MGFLSRHSTTIPLIRVQDDGSTPQYALPSPSKAGAIETPLASPTARSDTSAVTAPEDEEKKWDRVGWAPRFGMPGDFEDDDEEGTLADHQTLLEGALDDKFFGGKHRSSLSNLPVFVLTNVSSRLVPERWCHCLLMLRFMGYSRPGRRPGLALHRHGLLRNLLPYLDPPRTEKLPRRPQPRDGQGPLGDGH